MLPNNKRPMDSLIELGERFLAEGKEEYALKMFLALHELVPDNAVLCNKIGVIMSSIGEMDAAQQYFLSALCLDPSYEEAKTNLMIFVPPTPETTGRSMVSVEKSLSNDTTIQSHMSGDLSAADKVNKYWGDFFEKRENKQDNKNAVLWMDSPTVRDYVSLEYFAGKDGLSLFREKYVPENGFEKGIEIGAGSGGPSMAFSQLVQSLPAFDVSEGALKIARKNAAERNINNIDFVVADLNVLNLPTEEYDVAFFCHSLHHISGLESMFGQLHQALKPGGLIFATDFMGPNRLQWHKQEYDIMNEIDSILPDRYRRDSINNNRVRKEVNVIPLSAFEPDWPGGDPSEAVSSEEILPVMKNYFEVVEIMPGGGTILHGLLQGIIHNFDDQNPQDKAILELICLIEKTAIRSGLLPSYFNTLVARRPPD
jgi:ubiquinone/menaquinone biosynthesis C-methylase UbiE